MAFEHAGAIISLCIHARLPRELHQVAMSQYLTGIEARIDQENFTDDFIDSVT